MKRCVLLLVFAFGCGSSGSTGGTGAADLSGGAGGVGAGGEPSVSADCFAGEVEPCGLDCLRTCQPDGTFGECECQEYPFLLDGDPGTVIDCREGCVALTEPAVCYNFDYPPAVNPISAEITEPGIYSVIFPRVPSGSDTVYVSLFVPSDQPLAIVLPQEPSSSDPGHLSLYSGCNLDIPTVGVYGVTTYSEDSKCAIALGWYQVNFQIGASLDATMWDAKIYVGDVSQEYWGTDCVNPVPS